MIRSFFAVACFIIGCGQPPPVSPRVWDVSAADLYLTHRDRSTRWTGQTVRVHITPRDYDVRDGTLIWHAKRPTPHGDIVFATDQPPADNSKGVYVVGVVVESRDPRVTVRVEKCTVTAR